MRWRRREEEECEGRRVRRRVSSSPAVPLRPRTSIEYSNCQASCGSAAAVSTARRTACERGGCSRTSLSLRLCDEEEPPRPHHTRPLSMAAAVSASSGAKLQLLRGRVPRSDPSPPMLLLRPLAPTLSPVSASSSSSAALDPAAESSTRSHAVLGARQLAAELFMRCSPGDAIRLGPAEASAEATAAAGCCCGC